MARKVTQAIPTADDGPSYQLFMQHSNEVTIALIKKAEADSILQHAYKRAKAAGLNVDEFKRAHKAKKAGWEIKEQNEKDFAQYTAWLGAPVGTQGKMFADVQPPTEKGLAEMKERDVEQAGYTAGTNGSDISECPYKPGDRFHAAWVRGLHKGVQFMDGRGGDAPPRVEKVAARPAGSRKGGAATKPPTAKASKPSGTVHTLPVNGGGSRRVTVPPDVPTTLTDDHPHEADPRIVN